LLAFWQSQVAPTIHSYPSLCVGGVLNMLIVPKLCHSHRTKGGQVGNPLTIINFATGKINATIIFTHYLLLSGKRGRGWGRGAKCGLYLAIHKAWAYVPHFTTTPCCLCYLFMFNFTHVTVSTDLREKIAGYSVLN